MLCLVDKRETFFLCQFVSLVGRLIGWLEGWLVCWMVCWMVGRSLISGSVDWLVKR